MRHAHTARVAAAILTGPGRRATNTNSRRKTDSTSSSTYPSPLSLATLFSTRAVGSIKLTLISINSTLRLLCGKPSVSSLHPLKRLIQVD